MTKDKITAPFTPEEVVCLNAYQHSGAFHPFTCCSPENIPDCVRHQHREAITLSGSAEKIALTEGMLIATRDGWVCPCGSYKQTWAHKFMAETPFPMPKLPILNDKDNDQQINLDSDDDIDRYM